MGFRVNPNSAGRVSQSHFARIPQTIAAPRSAFDRSFSHKTTFNEGQLIPFLWEPILPGDTVSLQTTMLARLATPIFPYMDNVYLDIHYFFVPNRLLWTHWEKFQGAQDNPGDSVAFTVPQLSATTWAAGFNELSLFDYFGLPTKIASVPQANMPIALPLRAYNKIYNDWYRDEDLDNSTIVDVSDGPDVTGYVTLFRRRRKDYFTSCRPWPEKGGVNVTIPLGTLAPITGLGKNTQVFSTGPQTAYESSGTTKSYAFYQGFNPASPDDQFWVSGTGTTGYPQIFADLSSASAISINAMRQAIVMQQILELDARGGTRYVEALLARFGVVSPDFRLQRSEFIGGQTLDINVNPIAQTSQTPSSGTPQGNLAAFAVGRGRAGCSHSFVEHGQLLGICSIRADTTYQQGMSRHWSVQTRYDYYEPMMANLGEQAVLNKEIYMDGSGNDNSVFGYQERWGEYRYKPSYVTGQMRSNNSIPLDAWHLAVHFTSLPTLAGIVTESPPVARIVAVPSQPHFIVDTWTRFKHVRVMPVYSSPGLSRI